MGCVTMVVEIDGPEVDTLDPLGLKEAAAVDLGKYGRVRVTRVEARQPEQMEITETTCADTTGKQ